jgi:hypothetical protein
MKNSIVLLIGTFLLILLLSYQPPKTVYSQPVIQVLPDIRQSSPVFNLVDTVIAYKIKLDSLKEYTEKGANFIETQQLMVEGQTQILTAKSN